MITLKQLFLVLICVMPIQMVGQLDTMWTRSFGGGADDVVGLTMIGNMGAPAASIAQSNGVNCVVTSTLSANGDVPGAALGEEDGWIFATTLMGEPLWTERFGGSSYDRPSKIINVFQGGFVVVGRTSSQDGSFSDNHSAMQDGFVRRYAIDGTLLWSKCYGGSGDDMLYDVIMDWQGNLVACGETGSNDGDLLNTGAGLNWLLKINADDGSVIWSKAYEGPDHAGGNQDFLENFYRLTQINSGNYVCAGFTTPSFSDFNQDDILLAEISQAGDLQWITEVGSANAGDYASSIRAAVDGGFFVCGRLSGSGGNATEYYGGGGDFWLLRYDENGQMLWERNYGGSDYDFAFDMRRETVDGIWMAGFTRSSDGEATAAGFGLMDFFLIKTDFNGDVLHTERFGGSANDVLMGLVWESSMIITVGRTFSSDGFIQENAGGSDVFVSVWYGDIVNVPEISSQLSLFPNPATEYVTLRWPASAPVEYIRILDTSGRLFREYPVHGLKKFVFTSEGLQAGVYIVQCSGQGPVLTSRLLVSGDK